MREEGFKIFLVVDSLENVLAMFPGPSNRTARGYALIVDMITGDKPKLLSINIKLSWWMQINNLVESHISEDTS